MRARCLGKESSPQNLPKILVPEGMLTSIWTISDAAILE